jgi:histidine triad (HIT) family protein
MLKKDFYCDEILSGKLKVKKVYESKKVLAFFHTLPFYKIHVVIVPKEHIIDLVDLKEKHKNVIWEIMKAAKVVIKKLNLESKGIKLVTNFGKYQDSKHLHFHIISGEKIK